MATPLHQTIDSNFNEQQYTRNGFGVRGVTANVGTQAKQKAQQTLRYAGQSTSRIGKHLKEQALQIGADRQGSIKTAAMTKAGATIHKTGRIMSAATRGFAFRKGGVNLLSARIQVVTAMSWTGLLNIISFWAGILTLVALGATTIVSSIPLGETAAETVAWWFGYSDFHIWILAIGCFVLHLFFVLSMFMLAFLQLKLGGIQPIHGEAAGLKNIVLIAAFVVSVIPGANFFPWIWVWLFVVGTFPN